MAADAAARLRMSPGARKFALTVHLLCSVGWIGAVIAYLALDVFAVYGRDAATMGAALTAMALLIVWVIVPLALASLITGLIMSLGTPWGLLRHYWVLISFALTVFATVVLLLHVSDVSAMAASTGGAPMAPGGTEHHTSPTGQNGSGRGDFLHAGVGLFVLLVITTLNVYKPRGMTPYGWSRR